MSLARADLPAHPEPPAGQHVSKAVLDRVGAAVLLLLGGPWLLLVAMLLWIQDDGPVLARDRRIGQWGRRFDLLRFRTDASRVGTALDRSHLDELPQLINVLKGDMSLVGPRPPTPGDLSRDPDRCRWLSVKPGLIGPWPSGRAPRSPEHASVELDRYLRSWSPTTDLTILWHSLRGLGRDRRGADDLP
jgi:exopolysaccharide production protein ExoY